MEPMYRYGDLLVWAPTLAFLLVAALISFSRIFERNPATLGLLVAVVFWIWADLTHGFVTNLELKTLLFYLQFVFLTFIPLTWVGTCFRLAGQKGPLRAVVLLALAVIALVQIVLLILDRNLHWFFAKLVLPPDSWTFYRQNGPAYYAFVTLLF